MDTLSNSFTEYCKQNETMAVKHMKNFLKKSGKTSNPVDIVEKAKKFLLNALDKDDCVGQNAGNGDINVSPADLFDYATTCMKFAEHNPNLSGEDMYDVLYCAQNMAQDFYECLNIGRVRFMQDINRDGSIHISFFDEDSRTSVGSINTTDSGNMLNGVFYKKTQQIVDEIEDNPLLKLYYDDTIKSAVKIREAIRAEEMREGKKNTGKESVEFYEFGEWFSGSDIGM